jgi:hypothetical protein
MKALKTILHLVMQGFLMLLLFYWAIFAGNTLVRLFSGGPARVIAWYKHIDGSPIQWDQGALVLPVWDWRLFVARESMILAITLGLCYLEWRVLQKKTL